MTPAERALLKDCATALENWTSTCVPSKRIAGDTLSYIAALQQRIREALAKKGKR